MSNIYKEMMEQHEPSATLIQNTKSNMRLSTRTDADKHSPVRWKSGLRTVLIAAVIVVLSVTTVIATGIIELSVVREFFFGESTAMVVEFDEAFVHHMEFDSGKGSGIMVPGGGIINRSVPDVGVELLPEDFNYGELVNKSTRFTSFEELRQAALFDVREPVFPDGWWLSHAYIFHYEDGSLSYDILSYYRNSDEVYTMLFSQLYSGPDAYLDVRVWDSFDEYYDEFLDLYIRSEVQTGTRMVGDTEALMSIHHTETRDEYGVLSDYSLGSTTQIMLIWLKDDIAFSISMVVAGNDPERVESMIETMIKIAESV